MSTIKIKIKFTEPLLGTQPANSALHSEYIASKAPDAKKREEEIAEMGVEEVTEKTMTVFPRTADGKPFLWDYQWKGFLKEACSMLSRAGGKDENGKKKAVNESSKLTAFKKIIDGLIFVYPRRIPLEFEGTIRDNQRPLRAQTPQGERIALAHSEEVPEGAECVFEIECLNDDHIKAVKEWLTYGAKHGTGQWRNAGYGRFEWEEINE